ncbi:MAG: hypothetical protein ABI775_00380 [Pseudonocardiales bacterium]
MTYEYPEPPEQPPYSPPPPTANPYGAAPRQGYGQSAPYWQQPAYGQQRAYGQQPAPHGPFGQQPAAYGQQPYAPPQAYGPTPPAYNAYNYPEQSGNQRPGTVLGASVLAYVLAGLLILAGALLLGGASAASSFGDAFNSNTSDITAELTLDGFADLLAGGLLIAGGVSLTGRHSRGRTMLLVGAGITLIECVYWLVRTSAAGGVFVFVLVFGALAVTSLVLAMSSTASHWLRTAPSAESRPYGA